MTASRDRYGERLSEDESLTDNRSVRSVAHDPACTAGWLGEDGAGRLVPCLTCRPHLVGRRDRVLRRLRAGA